MEDMLAEAGKKVEGRSQYKNRRMTLTLDDDIAEIRAAAVQAEGRLPAQDEAACARHPLARVCP
eukprot:176194-Rhodomonas_salina.1